MAAPTTMWKKLTRRLGGDGNPLRRREDFIEAWLAPIAIALFLILSPVVVFAACAVVHAENAATRQAESSYRPVHAVLLQSSVGPADADHGANTWLTPTLARWTFDGRPHVGDVPAPSSTAEGSVITIWLSRAGRVQSPPLTAGQARDHAIIATVTALSALATLLMVLPWLARRVLDKRRLASWEADWLAVGPRWTRQT
jgi:hypothetical protein